MEIREDDFYQTAFRINSDDNVATALCKLHPGDVRLTGEVNSLQAEKGQQEQSEGTDCGDQLTALEEIPDGHKIAVRDIAAGEQILKYGISIGTATADIRKGQWVHLHCMRSNYDERSSHLDLHTGVPVDSDYSIQP